MATSAVTLYWAVIVSISMVTPYGLFISVPLLLGMLYLGWFHKLSEPSHPLHLMTSTF